MEVTSAHWIVCHTDWQRPQRQTLRQRERETGKAGWLA